MSRTVAPSLLVLTDRCAAQAAGHTLESVIAAVLRGGARTVVLREKDLPATERLRLALRLRRALDPVGGRLIVASDADLARRAGAAGVHLARDDPRPPPGAMLVGRSCHDVAELTGAAEQDMDYVTLSPVYPTRSKPGYGPALGPGGLAAALRAAPRCPPVIALGGLTATRVPACRDAGACGVAVMGALMAAADPERVVRALLREIATPPEGDVPAALQ